MKKKMIIITIFILILITLSLYYTYATDVSMDNTTGDADLTYNIDIKDTSGRSITVKAGSTKTFDIFITNNNGGTINYGLAYSPTKEDGITIAQVNTSKNKVSELIENNTTHQISLIIINNTSSDVTYSIIPITGYEKGGDLIVPDGYTLISDIYEFVIPISLEKFVNKIKSVAKSEIPNFANQPTSNEYGVYIADDNYGKSYYYRGNVENNYVKFAGFYWRIVRVNGDNSLRLIYDGTVAHSNSDTSTDRTIGSSIYSSLSTKDGLKYSGSEMETYINSWYETNLLQYDDYMADSLFCNDTVLGESESYDAGDSYAYYDRTSTNLYILTCSQLSDSYTKTDTTNGNGLLKYPISLITADEVSMAGKASSYFNIGQNYYTLTPCFFKTLYSPMPANIFVNLTGEPLAFQIPSNGENSVSLYVKPVISIKKGTVIGNGTKDDPYIIS